MILSEWCSFIVRETDLAFTSNANLASILTAVSAIETYLRAEYSITGKEKLFSLIEHSPIESNLKTDLQNLRKYRNKWVHVDDPIDDEAILEKPEKYEAELSDMVFFAIRCLRRTIYENPYV